MTEEEFECLFCFRVEVSNLVTSAQNLFPYVMISWSERIDWLLALSPSIQVDQFVQFQRALFMLCSLWMRSPGVGKCCGPSQNRSQGCGVDDWFMIEQVRLRNLGVDHNLLLDKLVLLEYTLAMRGRNFYNFFLISPSLIPILTFWLFCISAILFLTVQSDQSLYSQESHKVQWISYTHTGILYL